LIPTRPTPVHRVRTYALLALVALAVAGCQEESPTSVDLSLLPPTPVTLTIQLPWSSFGSNLAVHGGYSHPAQLTETIIARSYGPDALNANTLLRFASYPISATVRDSDGALRQDPAIAFYAGYVVAFFDSIASTNTGPVTIGLGALETPWNAPTATWDLAFDTLADQRPWPEPGGGPFTLLDSRDWDPASGDSVLFFLDSAQIAAWSDPGDPESGARVELLTDGERLRMIGAALRLNTRSSINPDTALVLSVLAGEVTFVYDVDATPPVDGMRVGGAPAWRTTLDVAVPAQLTGPPALCAAVTCPFTLSPGDVSFASLTLRSRAPPLTFRPTDSVSIDVRAVLSSGALPKSPLGASLIPNGIGQFVDPSLFLPTGEGSAVEIPITSYVRAFLSGPDASGRAPPTTLALLGGPEPSSFTFAEFFGPGPNEPELKLVVTVSPPLEVQ